MANDNEEPVTYYTTNVALPGKGAQVLELVLRAPLCTGVADNAVQDGLPSATRWKVNMSTLLFLCFY